MSIKIAINLNYFNSIICILILSHNCVAQSFNLNVFDSKDLFIDSLNFDLDQNYLKVHSPKGSLFNLAYDRNVEMKFLIPHVPDSLKAYGDSVFTVKVDNNIYKLHSIYRNSKPDGLWVIFDRIDTKRSEYMFFNGECIFANFYNESGILIRDIVYSKNSLNQIDRWYMDSKLIRFTFPVSSGLITHIYYPNGNLMSEYLYDKNGVFENGITYDINGENIGHVKNRGK